MKRPLLAPTLATLLALHGCDSGADTPNPPSSDRQPNAPAGPPEAGPIPEGWVRERADASRARMAASEPGRLLAAAIEAHGGLDAWLSRGTISFEFDYRPVSAPARRMHTRSDVDLWRARARQEELADDPDDGEEATFGWDGEVAWITPNTDAFPSTARFWSTTPFYFVGIPFVLADPGTVYERLPDAELDSVPHDLIKVSYESGTGDSPDDYYIIYLNRETHRVAAIRYVVAYPGFFPTGGHSPEKLMRYEDLREVDGVLLPHRLHTFAFDAETGAVGDLVTEIDAGAFRFGQAFAASHFAPPEDAVSSSEIERRE